MIKLREFPSLDLFFFARSRLLSHMRSDEPPAKIFAAKKNYKYTTTEKVFLKDWNALPPGAAWGKKLPSLF